MKARAELRSAGSYVEILAVTRDMRSSVATLRSQLRASPDAAATLDQLDGLREQLETLYSREEEGGYLGEILREAPQLSPQARRLRRQHSALLSELSTLQARVEAAMAGEGELGTVRDAFRDFRGHLEQHERDEDHLVQEAVARDLAAED